MPRRSKRDINGVLLLNKPLGITSNDAMIRIRGIFHAQKAGHTGALDPLATGMLPICLGEATKYSQYLLDADKSYDVTARFGIRTTTSDAEGEIIKESEVNLDKLSLMSAMEHFLGKQKQVPSMYSALKYEGRPLYEYARKGIEVPREARDITIFSFTLIDFDGRDAKMQVHCSKVFKLDRTQVADYPKEKMVTFEDIERISEEAHQRGEVAFDSLDKLLLPVDTAVQKLPIIYLSKEEGKLILQGRELKVRPVNMLTTDLQPIRIYINLSDDRSVFAGVGDIKYDRLYPKRLITMTKMPQELFSDEIV